LYLALCHADQRYYLGTRDASVLRKKLPMALIHEACGEVVYDGSGIFKNGQKVVLIPNIPLVKNSEIYENYSHGAQFLSSGHDGFMREFVDLPPDRVVAYENIEGPVAAIAEFISVAVHAVDRFAICSHSKRETVGIWGDGSLAYSVACVLTSKYPDMKVVVIGQSPRKLSQFSFVSKTIFADDLTDGFSVDHAFECAGGEGCSAAIDDVIKYINPQGTVMLMGVSENKVPVNTRDVLEKGLTFIGCSRSGQQDFIKAVELMEQKSFSQRLKVIIHEEPPVKSIDDIHRAFAADLNTPFKTVFKWEM